MRRVWSGAAAAGAVLATMVAVPSTASAAPDTVYKVVPFGPGSFSAQGAVRASLRNGTVTWYKDLTTGAQWVTLKADIKDMSTDGYCGRVSLANWWNLYGNTQQKTASECNAEWTNRTLTVTVDSTDPKVQVDLHRKPTTDSGFNTERKTWIINRPSGI
ncbi:hypothetical protein ACFC0D_03165 [Streptomyces sp. NPDC056222]|uniref:hypothetical protein n=1 Tax=Streptomyces sp. NPDC056222 TaxID=3345749 RepID=UPI0035E263C4